MITTYKNCKMELISDFRTPSGALMFQVLITPDDKEGESFFFKFAERPSEEMLAETVAGFIDSRERPIVISTPDSPALPAPVGPIHWYGKLLIRLIAFLSRWVR